MRGATALDQPAVRRNLIGAVDDEVEPLESIERLDVETELASKLRRPHGRRDTAQRQAAPRERRQKKGDRRARTEADCHARLDEGCRGLGGELLLAFDAHDDTVVWGAASRRRSHCRRRWSYPQSAEGNMTGAPHWREWFRGVEIAASIYAADFSKLGAQLASLLDAGARIFHFDVGDGRFIDDITMGPVVLEIDRGTRLPPSITRASSVSASAWPSILKRPSTKRNRVSPTVRSTGGIS